MNSTHMYTYYSNLYLIEMRLKKEDIQKLPPYGNCDTVIDELIEKKYIKKQLNKITPEQVREELREYGAWEYLELNDHIENLKRFLWVVVYDLREEIKNKDE